MNELVSPYTQYLYNRFNGYDSTRSLIQNRYTACLQGLLTIIRNLDQGFHNARIFPGRRRNCVRAGSVLIACIMLSCHKFFVSLFFSNPTPMRAALCKLLVEALMHVNVCCQIIVNAQNFIYIQYFPAFVNLYQVNVSTVKHSSCAMVLSFTGK